MGLFTLPPKQSEDYLHLDMFLKGDKEPSVKRFRRMLAPEWFPQGFVQLTWPHSGTDWAPMLEDVTTCYLRMAFEIATREKLLIVAPDTSAIQKKIEALLPRRATENITYFDCPTNDTWARDHAFLTVVDTGGAELFDFRFNGWGGKFRADLDDAINRRLYESGIVKGTYVDHLDFELEGGSIESDGLGTLLTTSQCLLNPNRNPQYDKAQIEMKLREWFNAERILWIDHGALAGDDTDSHIDTLARLCPDNKIVYVSCTDKSDDHYEELHRMEEQLHTFRNADNEPFDLVALPLPDAIVEDGECLPATYANYLVMNSAVLYPTYGQTEKDELAARTLQTVFPRHEIVGIDCRALIRQHGSLHCATMQFPKGILNESES